MGYNWVAGGIVKLTAYETLRFENITGDTVIWR